MSRTPRTGDLTVEYIRSELAKNRYIGDLFEALQFMLDEYDVQDIFIRGYRKQVEAYQEVIDAMFVHPVGKYEDMSGSFKVTDDKTD